ncbi:MAG: NAD(P)-dependent oxidoreductase [Bryobacteraceae bacterium]
MRDDERPVVLITGAAGYIGRAATAVLSREHRVIGLDVKSPDPTGRAHDWIECDFTQDRAVREAMQAVRERHGTRLASVIHLAAYYDFSGAPSPLYQQLTVEGTRRLMRELGSFETGQFVFSSNMLVHRPAAAGQVIAEFSPVGPAWEYPRSKLEAEGVIRRERGSIPIVLLRMAGAYDEDCHSIPIAQHIRRIHERQFESYFFPGNSNRGQAFVHIKDLADCLRRTVERREKLEPQEVFLVAEPEVVTYAEMQQMLGELLHGKPWPTIRVPKWLARMGARVQLKLSGNGDVFIHPWMIDLADADYPVSIGRAGLKLGWEPRHRLRDTIPEMVARLKENPRSWYLINHLPLPAELQFQEAR